MIGLLIMLHKSNSHTVLQNMSNQIGATLKADNYSDDLECTYFPVKSWFIIVIKMSLLGPILSGFQTVNIIAYCSNINFNNILLYINTCISKVISSVNIFHSLFCVTSCEYTPIFFSRKEDNLKLGRMQGYSLDPHAASWTALLCVILFMFQL